MSSLFSNTLYNNSVLLFCTCPLNDVRWGHFFSSFFLLEDYQYKCSKSWSWDNIYRQTHPRASHLNNEMWRPLQANTLMDLAEIVFGGGGTYGLSVGFPIMLIFFFFLHRGCWVLSHRECRTDSIFDQENKVLFHSSVFWASLQGKEIVFVILLVCRCAGVTERGCFSLW